ncbi:MAG: hypothetical protein WAN35_15145 [Terracidiphilus sp.]
MSLDIPYTSSVPCRYTVLQVVAIEVPIGPADEAEASSAGEQPAEE